MCITTRNIVVRTLESSIEDSSELSRQKQKVENLDVEEDHLKGKRATADEASYH